jgi:hypothetical protein
MLSPWLRLGNGTRPATAIPAVPDVCLELTPPFVLIKKKKKIIIQNGEWRYGRGRSGARVA